MKKKTIITALLALVALTGQSQVHYHPSGTPLNEAYGHFQNTYPEFLHGDSIEKKLAEVFDGK